MYVCMCSSMLPIASREVVIALFGHHVNHVVHRGALTGPVRSGQGDSNVIKVMLC